MHRPIERNRLYALWLCLLCAGLLLAAGPARAQAGDKVFKWRFGIYFPSMGSLEGQRAAAFADAVAKASNNRLQIQVYPGGMLGFSSFTHHRAVADGLLEMGTTMSAAMVEAPEWETLSHPLLFKTRDDVSKALDAAMPDLQAVTSRRFGSRILGTMMPEFDHMLTKIPLKTADSWKGNKFRAWQKQLACWFEQMGATPMVIPFHETYTALATGVVAGNSGGLRAALDVKLYEVTKYLSTGWTPNVPIYVTLVSEKAWKSLPADLQEILAREATKYLVATADAYWNARAEVMEQLVAKGMEKVTVAPEEIEKGRARAQVCRERWMSQTTPEAAALMKKIAAAIAE